MTFSDSGETPEEFWYNNLAKYQERESDIGFPQNLSVPSLTKVVHRDVAVFKGHLKNGDFLMIKGSNAMKLHEISKRFLRSN